MSLGMSPTWQLAHEDIHHFGSMYTHMYNISGGEGIEREKEKKKKRILLIYDFMKRSAI